MGKPQLVLAVENAAERAEREREEQLEIDAGLIWRTQLWAALRSYTMMMSYELVANELDKRWAPQGRGVSASYLRACLADSERNNFRAEWLDYFGARSEDVAALLARRVKPEKTLQQRFDDLQAEVRDTLSHKQAEALFRRAAAR